MTQIIQPIQQSLPKRDPIKLELYDSKKPDRSIGGEVTTSFIMATSSTRFHEDGLFSERIFGEIGSKQRFFQFGVVKLNTTIFHPMVYKDMIRSKALYDKIMGSGVYAKFDEIEGDFVQCSPDTAGANTGFSFFVKYFPKIKWNENITSLTVKDKIQIIKKFPDRLLIDRWLIIPAALREYKIVNGRGESPEINNLYIGLVNLARIDKDRSNQESALYDGLRYKIQNKVLEIDQFIRSMLKDDGFVEMKYGKRSIAWGTRNVISPTRMEGRHIESSSNLFCDESLVPLYQCAKAFQPLVINKLLHMFFLPIMNIESSQITAINKKTLNLEYIEISEKEKQKFMSSTGMGDLLNLFEDETFRRNDVTIYDIKGKQYYLYLVYDTGKEIYFTRSKTDIEKYYKLSHGKDIDPTLLRPLTYKELVFVATYLSSYDKHCLVTRYPVTWVDSMYPSKVKLASTTPARTVMLRTIFSGDVAGVPVLNYPIVGKNDTQALKLHPSKLAALDADHDGDQVNCTGVMSKEANDEMVKYLNSLNYYIDAGKKLTVGGNTYLTDLTLYNMTYMP